MFPHPEGGAKKNAPADHSVDMITHHLLFWNAEQFVGSKGEQAASIPADNKDTFNNFHART
jgi:hypothetical protein